MKVNNKITITLDDKDAQNFKSAIKKIADENHHIGLKNQILTQDEKDAIEKLDSILNKSNS